MKYSYKKLLAVILSAAICLSSFAVCVSAAASNSITLSFSENEDKELIISVFIPEPENLLGIDFSLSISAENAEIKAFSTEGTSTENVLIDFDNIPGYIPDDSCFTYTTTESPDKISFSGFFLDSLTTDEDFYLCDIIIAKDGDFSEGSTITFTYTLSGGTVSKTDEEIYSLTEKENNRIDMMDAFPAGDADLDGKTDASDARKILRASVGLETLSAEEYPYADTDYDGAVTSADARNALRTGVGLEKIIMHRFDFSLEQGKNCENGGKYTFICEITGISFSTEITNGGHICRDSACFSTGKCIVCYDTVKEPADHKFNENGVCTGCSANKEEIELTTKNLLNIIDEIHTYDLLAEESFHNNNKTDFINFTLQATKTIKKAIEACSSANGFDEAESPLVKAYNLRFDAFFSCMDENGKILSSTANCKTIFNAVKLSNAQLEYLSYLNE